MSILLTGINGFAASHLARQIVSMGNEVHGTVRVRSDLHRITDIKNSVTLHLIELTDSHSVHEVIHKIKPDQIYHLAAQSYVKSSWDAPLETYHTTVDGTVNLLEAVRKLSHTPRVFISSTSEIYGEQEGFVDENTPPNPNTHYGVAKLAQDLIGRIYAQSFGIPIVIGRSCNITGPGRADIFVDSNFAKQIVEIEKGLKDPILRHGNLDTMRDFVDVRDVIKGYIKALEIGHPGEVFCFGTGFPISIRTMLDIMLQNSTVRNIKEEIDARRLRPIDTKIVCSKALKAKDKLGWQVKITSITSFVDLLDYWRTKL